MYSGYQPEDVLDEALDKLLRSQHHLINASRYPLKKGCVGKFVEVGLGPAMGK